ncbi:hypothetical protein [Dyella sp. C9]|uniref:hypothetical protein n=1 Tax=Dyella sp. C9 TaxID=2202154 RepID=UPI0013007719|nr:hypothetical protein [Dyella sp. C9]
MKWKTRATPLLKLATCVAIVCSTVRVASAEPGGLPPWQFGMTPEQVSAFQVYGPYKSFRNGDLETYAGIFNDRKENVQFFFRDGRLARIGIYLYEGQDAKEAAATWGRAYATLKSMFGEMELPGLQLSGEGDIPPEAVGAAAGANVGMGNKMQMAPMHQGADKFVFGSFWRASVQGHMFYYVTVMYEPPHG